MEMTASYISGAAILMAFLVAFKLFDRTWAPPALIFVLGYVSATYLYAGSILVADIDSPSFAYHNFDRALELSTYSFLALLGGYVGHSIISNKRALLVAPRIFIRHGSLLPIFLVLAACLVIGLLSHPLLNSAAGIRGENAYLDDAGAGWQHRVRFIAYHLQAPLIVALFISSMAIVGKASGRARNAALFAAGAVIISTVLAFDRHAAASLLLMLGVLYHYRIQKIRVRTLIALFAVLMVLQAARTFRAMPADDRSIVAMADLFKTIDWIAVISGPFTAIAGWDVFTNVLDIVPARDAYKYGGTYFDSLIGVFTPRALGLGSYEQFTPSRWYMEWYAPGTVGHGFDFSMLAEAYINFGEYMFVVFFVVGGYLRWLSKAILGARSPQLLFFAVVSIEVLTFALRMDSNALIKGTLFKTLPVIVLVLLFNTMVRTKNGRPRSQLDSLQRGADQ